MPYADIYVCELISDQGFFKLKNVLLGSYCILVIFNEESNEFV